MPRGNRCLADHLDKIKAWAKAGMIDEEIAIRLGANWESVARVRRHHEIPNGREVLERQALLLRKAKLKVVPLRRDPEDDWKRLLAGRRFDDR